jgi:hypothetical protein
VPFRCCVLARVAGQKPRRPQFVRIAQLLGLPASQRHQPRLGLGRDRGLLARALAIIERRQWPKDHRSLDAALNRLMMHIQGLAYGKERWIFPVSQQHPRPLDPARWFGSRPRNRLQLGQNFILDRQIKRSPPCRHDLRPRFPNQRSHYTQPNPHESPQMIRFMESMY